MSQRAVIYARTSTVDQHTENQVYDLEQLARQRDLEIIKLYQDQVSQVPGPAGQGSINC